MMINGSGMPSVLGGSGSVPELHSVPSLDLSHPRWDRNAVEDLSIVYRLWCVSGDMCLMTMGAIITLMFNKSILSDGIILQYAP